ncbi:hypothetical protein [Ensifer sp. 4252]|uniref:hypothetical protein n=1 Tax=Ensifer sp. 4252 TaxID=3373915 RepID=UPI003D1F14A6
MKIAVRRDLTTPRLTKASPVTVEPPKERLAFLAKNLMEAEGNEFRTCGESVLTDRPFINWPQHSRISLIYNFFFRRISSDTAYDRGDLTPFPDPY